VNPGRNLPRTGRVGAPVKSAGQRTANLPGQ
jgi:hypothetical protein